MAKNEKSAKNGRNYRRKVESKKSGESTKGRQKIANCEKEGVREAGRKERETGAHRGGVPTKDIFMVFTLLFS